MITPETIVGAKRPRFLHKDDWMEVRGPWWRRWLEDMGVVKRKKVQYGTWFIPSYKPPGSIDPDK